MIEEIDFEELMSEPPHGVNSGRVRTEFGWKDLGTGENYHRSPGLPTEPIRSHGTRYAYQKRECRCRVCRDWNRDRLRRMRGKH